jgi:hypothetical protein
MSSSKCGNNILLIVSILGVVFMLSTYTETFINPGSYPDHVTKPLLAPPHGDFKLKEEPKFMKVNAADAEEIKTSYKLYSKTPLRNFKQITNNQKNWTTPCGRESIPSGICGGLYIKKREQFPSIHPCPFRGERVNFFNHTN